MCHTHDVKNVGQVPDVEDLLASRYVTREQCPRRREPEQTVPDAGFLFILLFEEYQCYFFFPSFFLSQPALLAVTKTTITVRFRVTRSIDKSE
jgi:hypothetical protein